MRRGLKPPKNIVSGLNVDTMYHHANDAERRKRQNPEAILSHIGVKPGSIFVDIGCGGGFFALPAARIVGVNGKVYGLDINADAIDELKRLAAEQGLHNMELVTGKAEEVVLCGACADIVFLGTVLHDFEDPAQVLENARQMLKANGHLVNLDWKKIAIPLGPPPWKKLSENEAKRLIEKSGFRVVSTESIGPYHYLLTASARSGLRPGSA